VTDKVLRMGIAGMTSDHVWGGQCYASQVYESLVPPATCPEDLALRQWQLGGVGQQGRRLAQSATLPLLAP
jgi:hypothetical protein